MACNPLDPVTCAGDFAQSGLEGLAKSFGDSAAWTAKHLTTAWMATPSPDVTGSSSPAAWLEGRFSYLVLVIAFLSVCFAAYKMATSGDMRHGTELAGSLFKLVAVTGLTATITAGMIELGDMMADWLLSETPTMGLGILLSAATSPGLVILLAVVVIIAQVVQLMIMLAKNALIVAMMAFLPLTAAATNTGTGKGGYQRAITWLAAAVLYKPVAAAIYALAFQLSSGEESFTSQMAGVVMMILAIFALPALMRLLAPVTAAASGGNAGALAGAAVGATIATGAVIMTGGGAMAAGGFSGGAGGGGLASGAVSTGTGLAQSTQQQTEETTR